MKLITDFSALWASVQRMGQYEGSFDLKEYRSLDFELDKELSSTAGLDIEIGDLELDHGVLSVEGRQVLLFIPDQGASIEEVLSGHKEGRRVHVADCRTLNEMRQKNRLNRYKATYNISGKYQIYGVSYATGAHLEGEAALKICKNCLSYLNYKGYQRGTGQPKSTIFSTFDIAEFLSEFSTLFSSMPERAGVIDKGGYADDWKEISARYRASAGYGCEQCRVDLGQHKHLLHTHHLSGNKRENNPANLKALCIDCHRKQPQHDYMRVTHANMVLINQCRQQQGLLNTSSWQEVRELADQALDGLLRYYEHKKKGLPEVGYELRAPDSSVVAELELAWPSQKRGIAISEQDLLQAKALGWSVKSVGDALSEMNR
ncbi:MAG: hypothetical protein ACI9W6_002933 [Motiliproteus sp.]|jgi:hypothetical protein